MGDNMGEAAILYTQNVRRAVLLAVLAPLYAQDAPPRSKAADYPAHVSLPGMEIAAEYLLHSIPTAKGFYVSRDYLVIDVGVFPAAKERITISSGQFRLRINHQTLELPPDSPGTVAADIQYPDWEQQRTATAQAGPVIVGAPPTVGRFPGDRRESPPISSPVPEQQDPSGIEKEPPKTVDQLVTQVALPEGSSNKPMKGCLFFHFHGKTKSIKSLELVYDPGNGGAKTTIPLF
jgi:hypothetical protein